MVKKIVVSSVTRGRPEMFGNLLGSLEELNFPQSAELVFCFVENSTCLTIGETVEDFSARTGCAAVALCEPRKGIPYARNKALDWSMDADADFLVFIDDDEIADKFWLKNLLDQIESRRLDLVGGPVFPVAEKVDLTKREALTLRGLKLRAKRIAERNERLTTTGGDQDVTIVTNNWMCRLDFPRLHGLRFDESLGFSGGSDAAFFRSAKNADAETGWAPEAIVVEKVPVSRLSFGYQFVRARDQAISSYRIRYGASIQLWKVVTSILFVLSKLFLGFFRIGLSLFDNGASIVLAIRAFGFAWGRILAVAGQKSRHYKAVHGS